MKVKIYNFTTNVERVCAASAKMSTTEGTCTDVYEGTEDITEARKSLSRIIKLGHVSVLEHANFNIMFQDVSLFFEEFIIEHRLSAYTIKSGRYVDFRKSGCYIPKFRFKNENVNEEEIEKEYLKFVSKAFDLYMKFADSGIKVEDARFVLPYSLKTNIFCTMNGREILHLLYSLLYGRGKNYPELAQIGTILRKELAEIAPTLEQNLENIEKGNEDKEDKLNELLGKPKFNKDEDKTERALIEVINLTEDPALNIAISAVIKNKQVSVSEAKEMLKDKELLNKMLDIVFSDRRKRELEQVNISFKINDIPIILLKHQVRHRLQNINIPSFTEMLHTNRYSYPKSITSKGEEYTKLLEDIYNDANLFCDKLINLGVYEEDLAYLFLHGKNVDVITTMNARNLYHICNLRTCSRAQWKMQEYYVELLEKLRKMDYDVFKRFGPNCYVNGYCPEGKLSCGKMKEMKEKFGS